LDWLDLGRFAGQKGGGFSAGMKQRLCLAQALIHQPEVLILDEPTANMDPTGRLSILDKLRQLAREQDTTILLSSHILSELEQIVDSMTMIYSGRLVIQGTIDEVQKRFSENQYLLKTSRNEDVLQVLTASGCVDDSWTDEEGYIHLIGDDAQAMRRNALAAMVQCDAELQHFSEERVSLQSIYRRTVGMEEA
jgi:ABC-2 type transport system ATP-binding protein